MKYTQEKYQGRITPVQWEGLVGGLETLESQGLEIISLRDYAKNAYLDGFTGLENSHDPVRLPIGFVREGMISLPDERLILVRDSPLIEYENARTLDQQARTLIDIAKDKVKRKESSREARINFENYSFEINPEPYLKMMEEDKELPVEQRRVLDIDLNRVEKGQYINLPMNELANDEIFRWAFKDYAKEHGEFQRNYWPESLEAFPFMINTLSPSKEPFARQIWYSPVEKGKTISNSKYLSGDVLGGVKE